VLSGLREQVGRSPLQNGACHVASRIAVDTPTKDSACVNHFQSQTTTRERSNVTVTHQTTVDTRTSNTIITGTFRMFDSDGWRRVVSTS